MARLILAATVRPGQTLMATVKKLAHDPALEQHEQAEWRHCVLGP
jgi:hypothetical protein